jgi:PHD/YefM family antitoxin component YafN of YafNO toxin-antitoxin module
MIGIHKKIVLDENSNPSAVIIPWDEFQEIAELLGLDLDKRAIEEIKEARHDRESGKMKHYVSLDEL